MWRKRKVCVVVTARPSYSRVKTALLAMKRHVGLELQLVVAASALLDRYGNAVQVMENDGFDVAARVYMILEGENLITSAKSTGIGIADMATVFDNLQPDMVVTIADRFETLATATTAAYMNIPLAHIQGGEITGSIDEKVRHAVTMLADIHFPCTDAAAQRIIQMGQNPDSVYCTGCPSVDLAVPVVGEPKLNLDPLHKYGGVGADLDLTDGYIVVLQHPVTTEYEEARWQINETLQAVRDLGMPALWFWPNVDAGSDGTSKGIRAFRENERPQNIRFFKNLAPEDFLRLINHSKALVGNSSVGIRESSFMGVPVVNIGTRQSGRERGQNVIDVGHARGEIAEALEHQISHGRYKRNNLYGDGNSGQRIAELIASIPVSISKRLAA